MYINDVHILLYVVIGLIGLFVGRIVEWCNIRLPEYKKIINPKRRFVEASHDLERYCKETRLGYILGQLIKAGLLEGCYVNGILIKSKNQRLDIKNKVLNEYEQMKQDIIKKVKSQIGQHRK